MKKILLCFIFLFLFLENTDGQVPCGLPSPILDFHVPGAAMGYGDIELRLFNHTLYHGTERSDSIKVKVIPVGFFYSGYGGSFSTTNLMYTIKASNISGRLLTGAEFYIPKQIISSDPSYKNGDWDKSNGSLQSSVFSYGYGKYKFEFYRLVYNPISGKDDWVLANYVYIDFNDIQGYFLPDSASGSLADMRIDYFSKDTITFQFDAHFNSSIDPNYYYKFWHIDQVNKELKVWSKYGSCIPAYRPRKGLMTCDTSDNGAYLKWPINANKYNGNLGHENPGEIGMNTVIDHSVTTHDTLISNPTNITILPQCFLQLDTNKTFLFKNPVSGGNNLIISDTSKLILSSGSNITVEANNKITLKRRGQIELGNSSTILFKFGSLFCNEGGRILRLKGGPPGPPGQILFEEGYTHTSCSGNTPVADYY